MAVNYQLALDAEINKIESSGTVPGLLLHVCCAPCASYVLEYLVPYFKITVFYYNPNIYPQEEYNKRADELERLLRRSCYPRKVGLIICGCEAERFNTMAQPFFSEPEGGKRCEKCFELRLAETAKHARDNGYEYFATTLTVSPHKNTAQLSEIGDRAAREYGVSYLFSDFKKRNGYKRSIELSRQLGLYRQDYCGCASSLSARKF